jgi:hypothetical protein
VKVTIHQTQKPSIFGPRAFSFITAARTDSRRYSDSWIARLLGLPRNLSKYFTEAGIDMEPIDLKLIFLGG